MLSVACAAWTAPALASLLPSSMGLGNLSDVEIDVRVLASAFGIFGLLAGAGLAPALRYVADGRYDSRHCRGRAVCRRAPRMLRAREAGDAMR